MTRDAAVREIGREITPEMLESSRVLLAPDHDGLGGELEVVRDLSYGPDERNRLDLHLPSSGDGPWPVFVFVHGGGFVMGDKTAPDSPFWDNVGRWASEHGFIGAPMTYRLAPKDPWPAGGQDVATAAAFLRQSVADHGGDPDRIVICGQSAGAAHVASALAGHGRESAAMPGVAAAVLISGLFDLATTQRNMFLEAYAGDDPSLYPERSSLPGLLKCSVPLLFGYSELDPADFQRQTLQAAQAFLDETDLLPPVVCAIGHNHLTSVQHLGTAETAFGDSILRFLERIRD